MHHQYKLSVSIKYSVVPSGCLSEDERQGLENRAHLVCPCLGISRHQSDCSTRHMTTQIWLILCTRNVRCRATTCTVHWQTTFSCWLQPVHVMHSTGTCQMCTTPPTISFSVCEGAGHETTDNTVKSQTWCTGVGHKSPTSCLPLWFHPQPSPKRFHACINFF